MFISKRVAVILQQHNQLLHIKKILLLISFPQKTFIVIVSHTKPTFVICGYERLLLPIYVRTNNMLLILRLVIKYYLIKTKPGNTRQSLSTYLCYSL